ncbi:glycoside hydrolase superfamily [Podospora conica]|nr:glycoside hydrolase superfamily [Schizothecium conicum]
MPASSDDDKPGPAQMRPVNEGRRRRFKLVLWAVVTALLIVCLALGLGLGLTLRHGSDERSEPSSTPPPGPTPAAVWQPEPGTTWQIVLNSVLDIDDASPTVTPDVAVFDIDMFLHQDSTVVANLHKLGKKVICYFSAGSYEPDRPDSHKFRQEDLGDELEGWPGERWLNVSSPSVRAIMEERIELASRMGCDAIDPDNIDGYQNPNGLDLTSDESVGLVKFLVEKAGARNLAVGLKNAIDIIPDVIDIVQFAVNEQCAQYNNCGSLRPFIKANKPVFHIEYPKGAPGKVAAADSDGACKARGSTGFSTLIKAMSLGGWVENCDGGTAGTKVFS